MLFPLLNNGRTIVTNNDRTLSSPDETSFNCWHEFEIFLHKAVCAFFFCISENAEIYAINHDRKIFHSYRFNLKD